jgi:hypothetical protein
MGFVTVNSPPVTAGGLVTSSHVAGGVRSGVDCSVKPAAFAGREKMLKLVPGQKAPASRNTKLGAFSCRASFQSQPTALRPRHPSNPAAQAAV